MLCPAVARRAASTFVSLIAPPRCAICESPCGWRAPICGACEGGLAAARPVADPLPGLDAAWSAASYEGVARDLVAALKFRRLLALARVAAAAISSGAPPDLLSGVLVPVPAAPMRLRLRGLDPAEEIAVELARLTGLRNAQCLARADGPRQVGRARRERIAAPPCVRLRARAPADAILIDDVATTGATLGACADALREGGATWVVALTFARSPGKGFGESAGRA
jgi:predicted amidophosphoribosyltransferase